MHPAPSHLTDMSTAELGDYLTDLEESEGGEESAARNRWTIDRIGAIRAELGYRAGLIPADHPQLWRRDLLIAAARRAELEA